ncbi:class A beta-lactamase-related serine hydrolase [Sphingomonas psychrotolerans]|uniref:Class A beta-lactamase-related serine hydrolase n=1 Tax=Sphingomonas psychrotolerans TaxID=1327635 RepID=A0ABU3N4V1_9SPHN|nr:serine hydrolase [Sphingomonas psychrotolerans]MDT8759502.1 class A beta-lactamase-related serine hydrolase [Sphingomonas psychrotolerans]
MAFRCRVPARWLATFFATAIAPIATAQIFPASITATSVRPAPAFEARVGELVAVLTVPDSYDAFFSAGLKTTLSKDKFDTLRARLLEINGPVSVARIKQMATPWSGLVEVDYHDAIATMQLDVDPAAPHQVAGLVIKDVSRREKSIHDILASLRSLHGSTGFALARLATGAATPRTAHQSDRPFAIGSAFKLIILAELVRATNAGERKWDDLVKLDGSALPGGGYNLKPKGTPVSLRELATQMISISDNSATDILLKALGREKVEAMLPVLGVKDPPRNRPFLSTMEVFKLKGIEVNDLASRYLAQDEAGRRRMLDGEVANLPALMIRPSLFRDGKPARIDTLEWFLSPADLVRVMDWLRRNTEGPQGADARAILSSNPGIAPPAANKWQWVGYKGGSEPGVMNMTLLLQSKAGDWYVLTASWNDPAQPVEEARFAALISRAAELAAP